MNNDHSDGHGQSPNGSNRDDILNGSPRDDRIDGGRGDDQIFGNGGNDLLKGGKDDDVLSGGAGNDILYGNSGKDILLGGSGNDILYGDDKSHGHFSFWWLCKPAGFDDYLDGGSGNDKVYGGGRNDFASYTMAENLGAHDVYDGGKGTDTLQLKLTYGEFALASVKQDIAHYQAFLTTHANPLKDSGATFQFNTFNLDASDFEALKVELVNTGPTAKNDTGATNEDTVRIVAKAAGLLANDTDPDHLDVLHVSAFAATSALGATVAVNADGSYSYDPTAALALQALAQGATATDTFTYTIADLAGATSTATVSIKVTGVNDAPVAQADAYSVSEDSVLTIAGTGMLGNDSDIDSPSLTALLVGGPAHGSLTLSPNGSFIYTPGADFNGSDSFSYRAHDGIAGSAPALVSINVTEVNDAPIAVNDAANLDEDTTATIAVLDNDSAGPANEAAQALTVLSASALHGEVTINPDGTLGYAPTANYNGADTISYTIRDNGTTGGAPDTKTASASVAVTVNPVNDAPVGASYNTSTDEATPITFFALINDTDVDGDTLTAVAGTFETTLHATVVLDANGRFTYDPTGSAELQALNDGQTATDGFTYTVSDGHGGTGTAHVGVVVNGITDASASSGQILPSISPGADLQYFVRVENGDWLELDSFSLGLQNSGSVGSAGGGGGSGKASADDVVLNLGSSAAILDFTHSLVTGDNLTTIEIEAYAQGGKGLQLVDEFKFNNAEFTKLDTAGSANQVSFDFGSFSHGHIEQDNKGAAGDTSSTGWDFVKNQPLDSLPNPHADADKADPQPQVPANADLDYYMRVENGDWLHLDSFSMGLSVPASTGGSGGGGGAGKATAQDVKVLLGSSAEILALTDALTGGDRLDTIEIESYTSGGGKGPQLVDEFKFNTVLVNSLDTTNASSNVLTFDFGSFSHGHIELDDKGGAGDTSSTGWDFVDNLPLTAPPPVADEVHTTPANSVAPGADLQYFVRVENGDWLELDSFSLGLQNSGSVGSAGGGGGSGKASADDVVLNLGSSAAILDFTHSLVTGDNLTTIEIEAYAQGGKGLQLVDEFKFNNAEFTKLDTAGSANQVSFDFGSFSHGHIEQDNKGAAGDTSSTGWDFVKNQPLDSLPNPHADADKADPQPQVPANADLDYYMRVENGDWLHLDSFSMGLSVPASTGGSGGGGGAGKATAQDVKVLLGSSAEILALTDALTGGDRLDTIEIESYTSGGGKGPQLVDEFKFNTVLVNSLDTTNASSNVLTFDFGSFSHGHIELDDKGGAGDTSSTGWDFVDNLPLTAPPPVADEVHTTPANSVAPGADLQYFVRVENGDWLELDSFSLGLQNSGSVGSAGGGGGSGKASADDVVLNLGSSAAILDFTHSLVTGDNLTTIEIEAYAQGGKGLQLVDEFKFNNAEFTKLDTAGSANQVSFDFGSFSHGHIEQDNKGAAGDTSSTGWDFVKNQPLDSLPNPHADADKADPQPQVPANADLDYYVHFAGADGWLRLDSFSMGLSVPASTGGSGGGAGKAVVEDVHLLLGSSAEILALTDALDKGTHLTNVEVEAYAQGGSKGAHLVDEFKFNNVLINSLDTSNASANSLTFDFGSFTHGHVEQDDKGASHSSVTGWDFVHHMTLTGQLPHPDVDLLS